MFLKGFCPIERMDNHFFTSPEAAAITGCSRRQLQFWREKRIVIPTVVTTDKGRYVYYSLPDRLALVVMQYLLTIGLSFEVCREALDQLRSKELWFFEQAVTQIPTQWLMFLPTNIAVLSLVRYTSSLEVPSSRGSAVPH